MIDIVLFGKKRCERSRYNCVSYCTKTTSFFYLNILPPLLCIKGCFVIFISSIIIRDKLWLVQKCEMSLTSGTLTLLLFIYFIKFFLVRFTKFTLHMNSKYRYVTELQGMSYLVKLTNRYVIQLQGGVS